MFAHRIHPEEKILALILTFLSIFAISLRFCPKLDGISIVEVPLEDFTTTIKTVKICSSMLKKSSAYVETIEEST